MPCGPPGSRCLGGWSRLARQWMRCFRNWWRSTAAMRPGSRSCNRRRAEEGAAGVGRALRARLLPGSPAWMRDAAGTDDRGSGRHDARSEGHALTAIASSLRAVGLLAVVGALLDPGCAQARRPTLDVAFAGDVADAVRAQEIAQIAAEAPWATVMDARRHRDGKRPGSRRRRASSWVMRRQSLRPPGAPGRARVAGHGALLVLASVHAPARVVSGTVPTSP